MFVKQIQQILDLYKIETIVCIVTTLFLVSKNEIFDLCYYTIGIIKS